MCEETFSTSLCVHTGDRLPYQSVYVFLNHHYRGGVCVYCMVSNEEDGGRKECACLLKVYGWSFLCKSHTELFVPREKS